MNARRRRWLALWRAQLRYDRHGGTTNVVMLPSIHRIEERMPRGGWRPDRWGCNEEVP